ncbi:hypothetical protein GCM10011612_00480 [Actinomyces gaoshouyii]|uniref:Uncharacterized protein n=1 Tax=Actinomyces gaoshouyii TaxID=1960083 RepID=A0A8H9H7S2_9ACTO|nr:hypothetical protein GCM10011612_00480 [Actinomyces gaoshouyii]
MPRRLHARRRSSQRVPINYAIYCFGAEGYMRTGCWKDDVGWHYYTPPPGGSAWTSGTTRTPPAASWPPAAGAPAAGPTGSTTGARSECRGCFRGAQLLEALWRYTFVSRSSKPQRW